jgi:hypothetical protein
MGEQEIVEAFKSKGRYERSKYLASIMGQPIYLKLLQLEQELRREEDAAQPPPDKPPKKTAAEPDAKPEGKRTGRPKGTKNKKKAEEPKEEPCPPSPIPFPVPEDFDSHSGSAVPDDIKRLILLNIANGMTVKSACNASGIHPKTFYSWQKKAERGDPDFQDFFSLMEVAFNLQRGALEVIVYQEAQTDPKMALSILERRYPVDWNRRQPTDAAGQRTATSIKINVFTDEKEAPKEPEAPRIRVEDEDDD